MSYIPKTMYCIVVVLLALSISLPALSSRIPRNVTNPAILIELNIEIGGGAVELITRALNEAKSINAKALILKINSYGGYLGATDIIIKKLIESNITCYAWIPPGGKAVSAASLIALACNKIYMGEGSNIGAAMPYPSDEKVVNYVASRFRSLAERHFSKNKTLIELAEKFVKENLVLTSEEACNVGFAYRADTISSILDENNLYLVKEIKPSYWEQILTLISSPLIAPIMFAIGVMLIFIEVMVTGFQGYVIAGILLLILSLYGMAIVTPDLLITIFLILGLTLIVVEVYAPGFGIFGIGGIIITALGIFMLFHSQPYKVITSIHIAILIALVSLAGFMTFVLFKVSAVMKKKYPKFEEKLIGKIGIAKTIIKPEEPGIVHVSNEDWTAFSTDGIIQPGEKIIVAKVEGLILYVKKL